MKLQRQDEETKIHIYIYNPKGQNLTHLKGGSL